jgi:hypothetical protein
MLMVFVHGGKLYNGAAAELHANGTDSFKSVIFLWVRSCLYVKSVMHTAIES